MALSASAPNIVQMVIVQRMRQFAVGLSAAFGLTRVLKSLLVQVSPSDPTTFFMISLTLAAAALGCLIPALRAMRVDPA